MKESYMPGVILAGGKGSRLAPCTDVTNKHLLPVYNKPMIYYPLNTLISAGITDILIVTGAEHAGDFMKLLGSGKKFGANFTYKIQDEAGGIAQALGLAEHFIGESCVATILGDNIFEDHLEKEIRNYNGGAKVFLKQVPDPQRFGIAEIKDDKITGIEEKPKNPKTDYAVTGLYIYDYAVFSKIWDLNPSDRDELEITDVNNMYVKENKMNFAILKNKWSDAGTVESLDKAKQIVKNSWLEHIFN